MLSTVERVLFLKSADIFGNIPTRDLVPVAAVADEVHFSPGELLIRYGDRADCLYIVLSGDVTVHPKGRNEVTVGEGAVLGEMGILSGRPRSADCIAVGDVTALRIGRDEFWELLGEYPAVALGVIQVLVRRIETGQ
ncbi:MAG TPA: cyclic nucleotide-binding domain-containing protein [Chloroflexota bacterium]|nr:cyclic nucleotide-binding domain-containing protein [Chloroflexota bacterium]